MKKQSEVKTVLVDDDYYPRADEVRAWRKKGATKIPRSTVRLGGGWRTIPSAADCALKIR